MATSTKNNRKISTSAVTGDAKGSKRKTVTGSSKSALPELNQAAATTSDAQNPKRKQSVLLPQTSNNNMIDASKKPGVSTTGAASTYKRSNSLLAPGKLAGKKGEQPGAQVS